MKAPVALVKIVDKYDCLSTEQPKLEESVPVPVQRVAITECRINALPSDNNFSGGLVTAASPQRLESSCRSGHGNVILHSNHRTNK